MLLRPGGLTRETLERVLDRTLGDAGSAVVAPGMLASHYAPSVPLRLEAGALEAGEAGLDFAGRLGGGTLDLSPGGDLAEAAANLYRYLRRLDAGAPTRIAVAPVPEHGLGAAINDRLGRAAAPRP